MEARVVRGDILDQDVEVIVNAWNQNVLPWWLLVPQGVSGAIRKRAGLQPFKELRKYGLIPIGEAVITTSGNLPFEAIIHVAGINVLWRATEYSIRRSVSNAMFIVKEREFKSVAFPIIGAGSGGFKSGESLEIMKDELRGIQSTAEVTIVEYIEDVA